MTLSNSVLQAVSNDDAEHLATARMIIEKVRDSVASKQGPDTGVDSVCDKWASKRISRTLDPPHGLIVHRFNSPQVIAAVETYRALDLEEDLLEQALRRITLRRKHAHAKIEAALEEHDAVLLEEIDHVDVSRLAVVRRDEAFLSGEAAQIMETVKEMLDDDGSFDGDDNAVVKMNSDFFADLRGHLSDSPGVRAVVDRVLESRGVAKEVLAKSDCPQPIQFLATLRLKVAQAADASAPKAAGQYI